MAKLIIKEINYILMREYSDNIVKECRNTNGRIKFRGFDIMYESFLDDIMTADTKQLKSINDITSNKFIDSFKIIITEDKSEQLHWNTCVAVKPGLFLTSPLSCMVYNFSTLHSGGMPEAGLYEEEVKAAAISNLVNYVSFDTLIIKPNELNYLISAGISLDNVNKVIIEMDYDSVKHIPDMPFPNIACVGIKHANYCANGKIFMLFLKNDRNINVSNYTARPFLDYYEEFNYDKNKYIGVPKILDNNGSHYIFEVSMANFIAYKPESLTLIKNAYN